MPATTPNLGLPYPLGPDPVRVAPDIRALAEAVDEAITGGAVGPGYVRKDGDTMTGVLHANAGINIGSPLNPIRLFEDASATFPNGINISGDDLKFAPPPRYMQHINFGVGGSTTTPVAGNTGFGVQESYTYWRSDGGFAFYQKGTHATAALAPGSGGREFLSIDPWGGLWIGSGNVTSPNTPGQVHLYADAGSDSSRINFLCSHDLTNGYVGAYGGWVRLTATTEHNLPALLQSTDAHTRVQAGTYVDIYSGGGFAARFTEAKSFWIDKDHHDDMVVGGGWHNDWNSWRTTTNVDLTTNFYANKIGAGRGVGQEYLRMDIDQGKVGSITRSSTGVSYNETSDYRVKDVRGPVTGALEQLLNLKPVRAVYHLDESHTEVSTFVAHEVAEVVPEAVTGAKDAVDADGVPALQQLDTGKLIPLIVAAIQELAGKAA